MFINNIRLLNSNISGMDTGNVDMAKTMAEVFAKGDANKDEKLNKQEFINVSR